MIEKVAHSDWAAPVVPCSAQTRLCGDYKVTSNKALEIDQYPLPKPSELLATLEGGKKFTTLDLSAACQQMRLEPSSCQYVTVNTHRGLYRYTWLPFGVASAPALFQKAMDAILQGIPHVICFIDDVLVTGANDEEHLCNLAEVLRRPQEQGMCLNRDKCKFLKDSFDDLGHHIDTQGCHMSTMKVEAILKAHAPTCVMELQSFLGLPKYYRKFIPKLASVVHPLNAMFRDGSRWRWSKQCADAFQLAKKKLMQAPVLAHYDPQLPIQLAGDASSYVIGRVLSRIVPDGSESLLDICIASIAAK